MSKELLIEALLRDVDPARQIRLAETIGKNSLPPRVSTLGPHANIWLREMVFPEVGSLIIGHRHNYHHVTFVVAGPLFGFAWDAKNGHRVNLAAGVYQAGQYVEVKKHRYHGFMALAANTVGTCIFALRDKEGKVTEIEERDYVADCAE